MPLIDNPMERAGSSGDPVELAPLAALGPAFEATLLSMYAGEPQVDSSGQLREIDDSTRIAVDEGMALFALATELRATSILEVGLAYGFSTVFLLAGLARNGGGTHVVLDPYQERDWRGIGLTTARRLIDGDPSLPADCLTLIPERSFPALGGLIHDGRTFDLTFVDGYHRFDDALVDFTLAARMCTIGGVIVMHDMWLDSIAAAASFIRTNRLDFVEIDTGCSNLFAVRRVGPDDRPWMDFTPFAMH